MRGKIVNEQGAEVVPARAGDPRQLDRAAVQETALALMQQIPDPPDDDGTAIYDRLLSAETWEDLNQEAKLPAGRDLIGATLTIQAMVKRDSDMESDEDDPGFRLSHYLVIDSVDIATGEFVRWQTSAPGLALPLCKLYLWGKLPATVRIDAVDSKRRRGVKILNLAVLAVH